MAQVRRHQKLREYAVKKKSSAFSCQEMSDAIGRIVSIICKIIAYSRERIKKHNILIVTFVVLEGHL